MSKHVIIDEVADFEATMAAIAARTEQRDRDWIAEYLTTGMSTQTVASGTCWDSADADVLGDIRRVIAAERELRYYPTPVAPWVYESVAELAAREAAENAVSSLKGSQVRGMLSTRDELVCRQALEALGC